MKSWVFTFFSLLIATVLVGCASAPPVSNPKAPIADRSDGDQSKDSASVYIEKDAELIEESPFQQPSSPIVARELPRGEQEQELSAVSYLLDQARVAFDSDELDRASALSDRALHIDRKSSRAYLILAQVSELRGQLERASQLARQGLLYTTENTPVGRKLYKLASI